LRGGGPKRDWLRARRMLNIHWKSAKRMRGGVVAGERPAAECITNNVMRSEQQLVGGIYRGRRRSGNRFRRRIATGWAVTWQRRRLLARRQRPPNRIFRRRGHLRVTARTLGCRRRLPRMREPIAAGSKSAQSCRTLQQSAAQQQKCRVSTRVKAHTMVHRRLKRNRNAPHAASKKSLY
jgi:hypothetical protein